MKKVTLKDYKDMKRLRNIMDCQAITMNTFQWYKQEKIINTIWKEKYLLDNLKWVNVRKIRKIKKVIYPLIESALRELESKVYTVMPRFEYRKFKDLDISVMKNNNGTYEVNLFYVDSDEYGFGCSHELYTIKEERAGLFENKLNHKNIINKAASDIAYILIDRY